MPDCWFIKLLSMRKIIDLILTINLLAITLFGAYLWWSGQLRIEYVPTPVETYQGASETEMVLFASTLREEVDRSVGQPIEGYEPAMFLAAFPGLVATDFEDVEASIGKYVVVEGQLVHVTPPDAPLHSAAAAITDRGLQTLLNNISRRTQINLTGSGTLTDLMEAITNESTL